MGISGAGAPSPIYQHPSKTGLSPRHRNQFAASLRVFPSWDHWKAEQPALLQREVMGSMGDVFRGSHFLLQQGPTVSPHT